MDKTFSPADIETRWYEEWEAKNYFAPGSGEESYCIPIPPPNVTGTLHMGHGFQQAIMDALIRYNRMKGRSTLWQSEQTMQELQRKCWLNVSSKLKASVVMSWDVINSLTKCGSGKRSLAAQLRNSCGVWAPQSIGPRAFYDGPELSEAVKEVFVRLYDEGLIYRGQRLVNWDPKLHTAISDLEVVQEEEAGSLWHCVIPLPVARKPLPSQRLDPKRCWVIRPLR